MNSIKDSSFRTYSLKIPSTKILLNIIFFYQINIVFASSPICYFSFSPCKLQNCPHFCCAILCFEIFQIWVGSYQNIIVRCFSCPKPGVMPIFVGVSRITSGEVLASSTGSVVNYVVIMATTCSADQRPLGSPPGKAARLMAGNEHGSTGTGLLSSIALEMACDEGAF